MASYPSTRDVDVLIIGAGAAGLMCAAVAGQRGRRVVVLDHANKPGKKILMSGGGRCNFTNYHVTPDKYLSKNPHFVKSALARYTPWHFLEWVHKYGVAYHEKGNGQLFCDDSAKEIVELLLSECKLGHVEILLKTSVHAISVSEKQGYRYKVATESTSWYCESLVIATGGLSVPTMGASPFGYQVAEQFGLPIVPTKAGLVPITLQPEEKNLLQPLSGISVHARVSVSKIQFTDQLLFTHRGLSGPAILQISSYWDAGEPLHIAFHPDIVWSDYLIQQKRRGNNKYLQNLLSEQLPKQFVATFLQDQENQHLQNYADEQLINIGQRFSAWQPITNGTEGYRTAEVTLGGVDTDTLSSKTLEVSAHPGLYFIGEVLDVAGWLGGYNFQWAWASGWAAAQVV